MNRVVITGSNGFIGQAFLANCPDAICVEQADCWHWLDTFDQWDQVGLILHQGAISSTTEQDVRKLYRYNIDFTMSLFELAILHGIPVKYASSASVYGNTQSSMNPLNQYAVSKLTVDYWVQHNINRFASIQGFRYFNVYGDGEQHKQDQASPVSKFTWQIQQQGYLSLFEKSQNYVRDFVCVDDVVSVVLNNDQPSGIYDLGTSQPVSFQHVAEQVVDRYGGEIRVIPFPDHLSGRYQFSTCAKPHWPTHRFKTVEEYLR
jgi:ADP-L-glycero-D-manno-heptose 6-epimerase